jgi:uncharacterized radical SAM superfamily Fe-S cluster-containing enzyme
MSGSGKSVIVLLQLENLQSLKLRSKKLVSNIIHDVNDDYVGAYDDDDDVHDDGDDLHDYMM